MSGELHYELQSSVWPKAGYGKGMVIHMGTFIIGAAVIGIIGLAVRSMLRDRKNGKSVQCGGDCKHCGGHCR